TTPVTTTAADATTAAAATTATTATATTAAATTTAATTTTATATAATTTKDNNNSSGNDNNKTEFDLDNLPVFDEMEANTTTNTQLLHTVLDKVDKDREKDLSKTTKTQLPKKEV
ncbi:hypothetical protein, partial [Salmonella sp. s51228]|uniref:hypothetical protein n=1 Tax=Salmonella sp. s51228 TaxID=3159652 RepID=UPI00397FAE73